MSMERVDEPERVEVGRHLDADPPAERRGHAEEHDAGEHGREERPEEEARHQLLGGAPVEPAVDPAASSRAERGPVERGRDLDHAGPQDLRLLDDLGVDVGPDRLEIEGPDGNGPS